MGTFLELGTGFSADADKIGAGKIPTGLANLPNIDFIRVNDVQLTWMKALA